MLLTANEKIIHISLVLNSPFYYKCQFKINSFYKKHFPVRSEVKGAIDDVLGTRIFSMGISLRGSNKTRNFPKYV